MGCKKETNLKDCNCTYPCERKGICCDCIRYRRARGELPGCYFSKEGEAEYDRSVEAYLKDRNNS